MEARLTVPCGLRAENRRSAREPWSFSEPGGPDNCPRIGRTFSFQLRDEKERGEEAARTSRPLGRRIASGRLGAPDEDAADDVLEKGLKRILEREPTERPTVSLTDAYRPAVTVEMASGCLDFADF